MIMSTLNLQMMQSKTYIDSLKKERKIYKINMTNHLIIQNTALIRRDHIFDVDISVRSAVYF